MGILKINKGSKQFTVFLWFFALSAMLAVAQAATVTGVRIWDAPDGSRVVLDLDRGAVFELFTLDNPHRVVVDLKQTRFRADDSQFAKAGALINGLRYARRGKKDLRLVLDLKDSTQPHAFLLEPNKEYGHRLVIDLNRPEGFQPAPAPKVEKGKARDLIIAIDAGHGGEDPGARGRRGTREKDVVLKIARRLARHIEREPGLRPVMIRDGDYYLSLRKRIDRARRHKADLFISIHADAFHNPRVRGASVYVLSERGASDETARWLAERENAADLVGGVSLDDKDDVLASVLLDLSMSGTIEASSKVADSVLREIRRIGPVHNRQVQHARFVVLKSPDVPSLLVETAFISNPREEKRLNDKGYQEKLARSMLQGIRDYFLKNPVPGTLLAKRGRSHTIRSGDTLSSIADRYSVPVSRIRTANRLTNDVLRVGQRLRIPFSSGT